MRRRLSMIWAGVLILVIAAVLFALRRPGNESVASTNQAKSQGIAPPLKASMPTFSQPQNKMSADSVLPDGDPNVQAGGRKWSLSFSDATLTLKARAVVARDLNIIFGHMPDVVIDKLPFPIEGWLGGKKVMLTRRVRFEGATLRRPEVMRDDPFFCLADGDPVESLYIPTGVTEAYKSAIERGEKFSAEYADLIQFLAALNQLAQRPIVNAKKLFLLAEDNRSAAPALETIDDNGFASAWGGRNYRQPSLLDITETKGTPLARYGPLLARSYFGHGTQLDELPPLIYHDGRWQLLMLRGE